MTRRRILGAARHLFFRDGYAATTLKAIAGEAKVAVQTVYAVFGSKAAILADLRTLVVTQPDADGALREAMTARTPEDRLRGFARSIRSRWELAGDIVKVNEDAVRADPSLRAGVETARDRRTAGIAAFVRTLDDDLCVGIDHPHAVAVVHALTLYDVFAELVGRHGWSPDAYETWLDEQLVAAVLTPRMSPQSRPPRLGRYRRGSALRPIRDVRGKW